MNRPHFVQSPVYFYTDKEDHTFQNWESFQKWKCGVELESNTSFVKAASSTGKDGGVLSTKYSKVFLIQYFKNDNNYGEEQEICFQSNVQVITTLAKKISALGHRRVLYRACPCLYFGRHAVSFFFGQGSIILCLFRKMFTAKENRKIFDVSIFHILFLVFHVIHCTMEL